MTGADDCVQAGFVGREREITRLLALLEAAGRGDGSLILLAGEPGIGKTRTAEELAAIGLRRGVRVVWGRCLEGQGAPAFWPWTQVIRALLRERETMTVRAEPGIVAGLAQLIPELQTEGGAWPPAGFDTEQARFRLFQAVTAFITASDSTSPWLIILDDLHWADVPSLLLLQFIARSIAGTKRLILGTYRDVEIARGHPLAAALAELARGQACERIGLKGLDEAEVARFIEHATGSRPLPTLVTSVTRRTEGNPFFLKEMLDFLHQEGRLERCGDEGGLPAVPESIRAVIGRRLDRLSTTCNRLLEMAAVLGREFSLAALEGLSQEQADLLPDGRSVPEVLEEAEAARVIQPVPTDLGMYRFTHALIGETLYDELTSVARTRLHSGAARVLTRLYHADLESHLEELAHHAFQAAPAGFAAEAVAYAVRAAERSLHALAYEEAVRHYRMALQALQLLEPCTAREEILRRRCEFLLALGSAQRRAGELQAAMETFQWAAGVARTLLGSATPCAPALLARAACGYEDAMLPTGLPRSGPRDPSILLLEEALQASDGRGAMSTRVLAGLARAVYFAGLRERGVALSAEAVRMAREEGDVGTLAYALNARRMVIGEPQDLEERLAIVTELVDLAEQLGDREMELDGRHRRLRALLELGDVPQADEEMARFLALAEDLRQPAYLAEAAALQTCRALWDGRFVDAEATARRARALAERAQNQEAAMRYTAQLSWIRREQGRMAAIEELLPGMQELASQQATRIPALRARLGLFYLEAGHRAEARAVFDDLIAGLERIPRDWRRLCLLVYLAELCAALADRERASLLYDLLLPWASQNVVEGDQLYAVAYPLALLATCLGHGQRAAAHFEQALAAYSQLRARPALARTCIQYATMLLSHGRATDQERVPALLDRADSIARHLGMQGIGDQIEALGRRMQNRPSSPAPPSPGLAPAAGLTPREIEVLALVAAGKTNREIAEQLVLSLNTVWRHVSHILTKTGSANRTEAAAYAHRLHIVT